MCKENKMTAVSFAHTWFVAARPWSFTTSGMPIVVGSALGWWASGQFHPLLFILVFMAGVSLHVATNYLNTYGDFIYGVDTLASAKTCPQLVSGQLTAQAMRLAGLLAVAFAGLLGLVLALLTGWPILVYGILGVLGAYGYTTGFSPYKYKGLGPPFVFILMGPLMVAPAYYAQTGQTDLLPFLAALPVAFLVTGIIQGNDLRDINDDRASGIMTMAIAFGRARALTVYQAMYAGAYLSLIGLVVGGLLPWTALLPILLLPADIKFLIRSRPDQDDLEPLEGWSAKTHFLFCGLYAAGLLLATALQWIWPA